MIDTYGHILYGYKIDEAKLSKVLGDDFEDFEEEYLSLFGDMVGEETPGWIPDRMRGEDAYFGIDIWSEDLDGTFQEPFEIPQPGVYSTMLDNWVLDYPDLAGKILSCAESKDPKMFFTVVYN